MPRRKTTPKALPTTHKKKAKKTPAKKEPTLSKMVKEQAPKEEAPKVEEAHEKVVKLTETEALMFGKTDAEMRNNLQGIQLKDFELDQARREYLGKKQVLEQQKQALLLATQELKPRYDDLVQTIAKKYKIKDPKKMSIDPDSGTLRDLTKV